MRAKKSFSQRDSIRITWIQRVKTFFFRYSLFDREFQQFSTALQQIVRFVIVHQHPLRASGSLPPLPLSRLDLAIFNRNNDVYIKTFIQDVSLLCHTSGIWKLFEMEIVLREIVLIQNNLCYKLRYRLFGSIIHITWGCRMTIQYGDIYLCISFNPYNINPYKPRISQIALTTTM